MWIFIFVRKMFVLRCVTVFLELQTEKTRVGCGHSEPSLGVNGTFVVFFHTGIAPWAVGFKRWAKSRLNMCLEVAHGNR